MNSKSKKEFKEIKVRGIPANIYDILLEMQAEEHRPSLNNFILAKLIELAEKRGKE